MNKIRVLLLALCLSALPAAAQRRYYRFHTGGSDNEAYHSTFTGNFFFGGISEGIGYTIGAEYEITMGNSGLFSFNIPAYYLAANDHVLAVAHSGDVFHNYNSFYTAPGFRYHPFGAYHLADLSVGVQLAVGSVNVKQQKIDAVTGFVTRYSTSFVAPLAQVNLNLTPKHGTFVVGFYIGAGPVTSGDFGIKYTGAPVQQGGLAQFGIKLGGKF